MIKLVKAAAAASVLAFGATMLMAQAQNPDNDQRPLPPDGSNNQPYDEKAAPTNPPKASPGVGTRPIGPPKDEAPTDPNTPKQPELKKLDKEGRGGQQN